MRAIPVLCGGPCQPPFFSGSRFLHCSELEGGKRGPDSAMNAGTVFHIEFAQRVSRLSVQSGPDRPDRRYPLCEASIGLTLLQGLGAD